MSLQKKNVIQGFMKDEHLPTDNQFLVKYCSGKGNNLHEVECIDGSTLLVSMPKKYRHTVWLKRDDCLVIDPIEEGKKVKGEIVCLLPHDAVRDLIRSNQWPKKSDDTSAAVDLERLLQFFTSASNRKPSRDEFDAFPSTDSSDMETDEDDDDEGEEEEEEEGDDVAEDAEGTSSQSKSDKNEKEMDDANPPMQEDPDNDVDDMTRDRNRSRVQLVTSGIVTVTNVLTEDLTNDIQSLEFEADEEESSDELANNVERHANTIRIQVNYNSSNDQVTN